MKLVLHEYGPTRAARCLWTLRELGVPFERVEVDLSRGAHRDPAFLALNPMGRVPVLQVDDAVLTESLAICTWLADAHPGAGLIPRAGTIERAVHDRWMYFCATELDAPLWRIRRNARLLPPEQRIEADVLAGQRDFDAAAEVLARALGDRPTMVGDRFSVVDIVLTHTLFWAAWERGSSGPPPLPAYVARHRAREACPDVMRIGAAAS